MDDNFADSLINAVREFKCLYDKREKSYHDRNEKNKAWKEIAVLVGKDVKECESRWRSLRERFSREVKKIDKASGSGSTCYSPWRFLENLMFLKDYVQPRRTLNNENASETANSDIIEISPPPLKRRQASFDNACKKFEAALDNITSEECDTDKMLMTTVVSLLKDLPETAKDEARSAIFNTVMAIRSKYLSRDPSRNSAKRISIL